MRETIFRDQPALPVETEGPGANTDSKIRDALLVHRTRPAPERIRALEALGSLNAGRDALDRAFAVCESVAIPSDPLRIGFDPDCPRLDGDTVRSILRNNPGNARWLARVLNEAGRRWGLALSDDPVEAADRLLAHLVREVSFWEADAFPLEAMADLPNRYGWTFSTDAWSLREQLRREARVVRRAWLKILEWAESGPLLVILNERAPSDYMTCALPPGAAILNNGGLPQPDAPILLHTGLKIASSEHRDPLAGTPEGDGLARAVALAREWNRRPVLLDFSRRRFPRAFLRVCRFARKSGWGVFPVGKVGGPNSEQFPRPKSPRGLPRLQGDPVLHLFDPWPISDPDIVTDLDEKARAAFCQSPQTKPWQDDRIGARTEMEADEAGVYRPVSEPWAVPVLGGWARTDDLFKSRLARFLRFEPS